MLERIAGLKGSAARIAATLALVAVLGSIVLASAAGATTPDATQGKFKLPYSGTVSSTNPAFFVHNTGSGTQSFGIRGDADANYGIAGISGPSAFAGVFGTSSGANNGVFGQVNNSAGSGVFGQNDGTGAGVTGTSNGFGIAGNGLGPSYAGVYGTSAANNGVFGEVSNGLGSGIYGHNMGTGYGVAGISHVGTGVFGKSDSTGAVNGVFGQVNTATGSGVYGQNDGTGYGIAARSASGTGGYFEATGANAAVALKGGIRVVGAGIDTPTPVFTHMVHTTGSVNTCEGGRMTILDNPYLNGHPDAFVFFAVNFDGTQPELNAILHAGYHPSWSDCPANRWVAWYGNIDPWGDNTTFQVMVINP